MGLLDVLNRLATSGDEPEGVLKSQNCRVERVVPGRLLYVDAPSETGSQSSTFAFPLDRVIVVESNGNAHPYRGEPLSDLGLKTGRKVRVVEFKDADTGPWKDADAGPWLVVDSSSTAQKLTDAVTHITAKTIDLFK